MIDSIKLKNLTTNKVITLNKSLGNSYVLETDGIDWGTADATHHKYQNQTGIGEIITSTKISTRTITIIGRICSVFTLKQLSMRYGTSDRATLDNYRIDEIEKSKKELSQLINPENYIRVFCGDYYIDGKATSGINFSYKWKENNEVYCKFAFSLDCKNPLFQKNFPRVTQMGGITGGFHFPLIIPENVGIHMGIKQSYQLLAIENDSDVEIGGVIYMKASGTVENPSMTNVYTNESLQINKTLSANEIVRIDTVNRKITGSTDGGINFVNYFAYWDFENDWLQFEVGESLLGYSADNETYKELEIWIEINKGFFTMEEQ